MRRPMRIGGIVAVLMTVAGSLAGGIIVTPAAAQEAPQRQFQISAEARQAIRDLQNAVNSKAADIPQRLAAAQGLATTADDRYVIAKLQLQHAIAAGDKVGQAAAARAVVASGGADQAELRQLTMYLGGVAANNGDFAAAETAYTSLLAAEPNNLDLVVNLARIKIELKKDAEALDLLQRAIRLSGQSGQTPPEAWYRNALAIAHRLKRVPLATELSRDVLRLYPSKENLSNAMALYFETAQLSKEEQIDFLRLRYLSGTLTTGRDYLALASALAYDNFPGEAKAVLEAAERAGKPSGPEGAALLQRVSARISEDRAALPQVEPKARAAAGGSVALSLATAYFGYGEHARAIDLYRLALEKGGVDPNLVNTRLAIALALAGRRAEAEGVFRSVGGTRSGLANLWLAWLSQGR